MALPRWSDVLGKVPGLLNAIDGFLTGLAEKVKAAVPDAGPAVDEALAEGRAKVAAFLNEEVGKTALVKVAKDLKHLADTGYSSAKPDPGDVT